MSNNIKIKSKHSSTQSQTSSMKMEELVAEYISQMDEKDRIAYEIAKDHLETSFDIEKSIGFQDYLKERANKNKD